MKILLENWRQYLKEQADVPGGPGDAIGTIRDVGSDLYRISKRYASYGDNLEMIRGDTGMIKSSDRSADDDVIYTNSKGEPEHRIYFFKSQDDATAAMMSDVQEVEAIVGDFSAEDKEKGINENLILVQVSNAKIDSEVQFFEDPELKNTPYDAIYGAYSDGRAWTISLKGSRVQSACELLKCEEDDYYEDY
tara:strand:- start:205 stop:780 length:576 start_codon:yes stop_codon:yes gene_type:complete